MPKRPWSPRWAPAQSGLAHDFGVVYSSPVLTGPGSLVGQRAPHAWICLGRTAMSTVDLFDARLTVIVGPAGAVWRDTCDLLAISGVPIVAYRIGIELHDTDGMLADTYQLGADGCVLVRPDGYIAWQQRPGEALDGERLRTAVVMTLGQRSAAPATLR